MQCCEIRQTIVQAKEDYIHLPVIDLLVKVHERSCSARSQKNVHVRSRTEKKEFVRSRC